MKKVVTIISLMLIMLLHNLYSQACTNTSTGNCTASNEAELKAGAENLNVTTIAINGNFGVTSYGNIRLLLNDQTQRKVITTNGTYQVAMNACEFRILCKNFTINGDYNSDGVNDLTLTGTSSLDFFSLRYGTPKSIKLVNTNFYGDYERVLIASQLDQDLVNLDFEMVNCDVNGFTEKGIVFNRRGQSYDTIDFIRIFENTFTPSPNARTDGQYRAFSFDAGNDMADCTVLCNVQNSSNGVAPRVNVVKRAKVSGNQFINCGIAFARYNHIDITSDPKGPNEFIIDNDLPGNDINFKYKCLNIENDSNDVLIDGNTFSIERTSASGGYTRALFAAGGSEWIKNAQASGDNNDDGDYTVKNLTFTNNVILPASNTGAQNQLLDYMYIVGVENMEISGNNFNNRTTKNTPMGFDEFRYTAGGTTNSYISGNTNLTILNNQSVATKSECSGQLQLVVRTESCSGHNIDLAEAQIIVTLDSGVSKCTANQCMLLSTTTPSNEGIYSIYPNPADEEIVLKSKGLPIPNIKLSLFNGLGALILDSQFVKNQYHKLNTSKLGEGVYHLSVSDKKGDIHFYRKIIVSH